MPQEIECGNVTDGGVQKILDFFPAYNKSPLLSNEETLTDNSVLGNNLRFPFLPFWTPKLSAQGNRWIPCKKSRFIHRFFNAWNKNLEFKSLTIIQAANRTDWIAMQRRTQPWSNAAT